MKNILILLLFYFLPFQAFSQFENTGFGLAINNSYPHTTYQYRFASKPLPGQDETRGAVAYHADIHTFYKINPKFSIKTGVGFIKNKFLYDFEIWYSTQTPINKDNTHLYPYLGRFYISLNYISLPVGINYKLNSKWEIGTGIQNNFLLSAYVYSRYYYVGESKSNYNRKNFQNDIYASYTLSSYLEASYHFNFLHFPLSTKAQLSYGVSNYFSKEIPGTLRPITMNIGLAAKFKN